MLKQVAEKSTSILLNRGLIQLDKQKIYVYGFELFCSTVLCILSILFLGVVFGTLPLTVVFILFFIPIRIVAGGYHAKSYTCCFALTNSIAILSVIISKVIWFFRVEWVEYILWALLIIALVYIWRHAPAISKKYPQKMDRIIKNRKYVHIVIGIEMGILLIKRLYSNSCGFYTAAITTYVVTIMIAFAERGGD